MKIARLQQQQHPFLALVDPAQQRYWPLSDLVPGIDDITGLISQIDALRERLPGRGPGLDLADATILAPLSPARNLFCVGMNYHAHAAEFSQSGYDSSSQAAASSPIPTHPVVFTKPASTIIGPNDTIPSHAHVTQQVDYEAELAVVIGRAGRDIAPADALSHVFGYTILNDVTARDLQKQHVQWFLGKSLDGFCPMGPYLVTADELDGTRLDVRCWVNGELRQSANTAQLIFDIPTLIATLSAGRQLEPGDVIATGTPAGVGLGFNPPRFLRSGDVVRIEIEGLGVLENTLA